MQTLDTVILKDRAIVITNEAGSADGYVTSTRKERLGNYLSKFSSQDDLVKAVRDRVGERVAILSYIEVDEESRGRGYGDDLLNSFIDEAFDVPVLLIACRFEQQAEGFDLVGWYHGFGFVEIAETGSGSLMLLMQSEEMWRSEF